MALRYPPKVGEIYMCEFPPCLSPPEMVKKRPVIIVAPPRKGGPDLVTLVPISMTDPEPVEPYHAEIPKTDLPKPLWGKNGTRWAKCDMLYTLNVSRLELARTDRQGGVRTNVPGKLTHATLLTVRQAIAKGLGIHYKHLFDGAPKEAIPPEELVVEVLVNQSVTIGIESE